MSKVMKTAGAVQTLGKPAELFGQIIGLNQVAEPVNAYVFKIITVICIVIFGKITALLCFNAFKLNEQGMGNRKRSA